MASHGPSPPLPAIKRGLERLHVARMGLALFDRFNDLYAPGIPRGQALEAVAIALAVLVGHLEGKPMTASKLAGYAQLPRATVVRKVRLLVELGIVERRGCHYLINAERANSPEAMALVHRLIAALHVSLREIEHASNLDTMLDDSSILDSSLTSWP